MDWNWGSEHKEGMEEGEGKQKGKVWVGWIDASSIEVWMWLWWWHQGDGEFPSCRQNVESKGGRETRAGKAVGAFLSRLV